MSIINGRKKEGTTTTVAAAVGHGFFAGGNARQPAN
jgi:hypothetical protein